MHISIVQKQIIALGGGGFSDNPEGTGLDVYILNQSAQKKPKILFIPSAGGDDPGYIKKFYTCYGKMNCTPAHIELSKKTYSQNNLEKIILSQDIIFVGGGSAYYLIKIFRKTGTDKILKRAWKNGIILSGMSAGAMCWFGYGFRSKEYGILKRIRCLGFLEGIFCPHYDNINLKKSFNAFLQKYPQMRAFRVKNGTGLHFFGNNLEKIIRLNTQNN